MIDARGFRAREEFFVPGLPRAQPRARVDARGGRPRVYTPKSADLWKATIVKTVEGSPFKAAKGIGVSLRLEFLLERPKAHYGTGRNEGILKDSAPADHVSVPDLDNLEKAVKDALKGHLWHDDSQVFRVLKEKRYTEPGEREGLRMVVRYR